MRPRQNDLVAISLTATYLDERMNENLSQGLDRVFGRFASTKELVDGLIRSKSHSQEILILLCSRIDALASGAAAEDEPRGRSFTGFLATYSGQPKLFDWVSAGDLYYELAYHSWLMPGMLEKPGRLRVFSRLNEPILKLLVDSDIALTQEDAQILIKRIQRGLRKHFRVAPNQPRRKQPSASVNGVRQAILDEFSGHRSRGNSEALRKALDPLVSSKTLARILYERFRCEAIHGGRVLIDETKFFSEKEPYWKPMYSEFYGPFQLVEFPAQFLASLLSDCIRNYRKRLEVTGKLPPNVHFEMFPEDPFGRLDLLDETLLPRGRTALPR
jgi:hypothetical protein